MDEGDGGLAGQQPHVFSHQPAGNFVKMSPEHRIPRSSEFASGRDLGQRRGNRLSLALLQPLLVAVCALCTISCLEGGGAEAVSERRVHSSSSVMEPGPGSPALRSETVGSTQGECPDARVFYDRLFARDEIDATIAFGYLDEHLPTLKGYLVHVLLKLQRVPIFLNSQEQVIADLRSRLAASGFRETESLATRLKFERKFEYRGRPKTLRVHVGFSLARCPGESTDEIGRLWRYDDETCAEQQRATAEAKALFADSLVKGGIAVYHGHARRGRGLDFGPMGLDEGKLPLDCESLSCGGDDGAQTLVFVNGCDTTDYYGSSFAALRQEMPAGHALAWLTTRGNVLTLNAPQTTGRLLDMLVEARCPEELVAVLNQPRQHADDLSIVERGGF